MKPMQFSTRFDPRSGREPQWKVFYVDADGEQKNMRFWTRLEAATFMTCAGYELVIVVDKTRRSAVARNQLRRWRKYHRHLTHDFHTYRMSMLINDVASEEPHMIALKKWWLEQMREVGTPFTDWCRSLAEKGLE